MHPFLLNTSFATTGLTNSRLFVVMDGLPYNWYQQGETWGSQYGLTHMWPIIYYISRGSCGPSRTTLATGVFPNASGAPYPTDATWQGIGIEPNSDIDLTISPWNTSTGYIGMTFGSTGFLSLSSAERIVRDYRWVPVEYRTLYPDRSWRAFNGVASYSYGITGTESILSLTPGPTPTRRRSHWLKRKSNFLRKELNSFYDYCVGTGYIFSHIEIDDEFMDNYGGDISSVGICGSCASLAPIGDPGFLESFLYSTNSPSGNCWYASFTGICAAPDCLVAEGITSMRSFLLSHGFTTTPGKWRNVDGMTMVGPETGVTGVTGNISTSSAAAFRFFGLEYHAAIKDWIACMWTDFVNDFKLKFNITADNSLSGNYGYSKNDSTVIGYKVPGDSSVSNDPYVTNSFNFSSSDPVPYPDPINYVDQKVQDYYGYNLHPSTLQLMVGMNKRRVGDIDNIHCYGTVNSILFADQGQSPTLLDRNLDFRGNSYFYSFGGKTFGIGVVPQSFYYNKLVAKFTGTDIMNQSKGRKFFPAGYLGTNIPAQTLWLAACAEQMGNSSFFQFDPAGLTATAGSTLRCSFDRAPYMVSWHLNPLWGLTLGRLGGPTLGPANFVPQKGQQILNGLTAGSVTKSYIGNRTTLNFQDFDSCGYPFPGNTLPAGTLYKHYWTHWYPVSYIALLNDVKEGRSVATLNVAQALKQITDPSNNPLIPGSIWNYRQKPINVWIHSPIGWYVNNSLELSNPTCIMNNFYSMPVGVSYGYILESPFLAKGICYINVEISPMYYEHIRHQYLNKVGRMSYWNPANNYAVDSTGRRIPTNLLFPYPRRYDAAQTSPLLASGLTSMGGCGAIAMHYARNVNKVIDECNRIGDGIVSTTHYLAPVNMDERSYLISGAQANDGRYHWRITFAHPVTYPSLIVRGSVSGITTEYRVAGITDFVNISNNKFGIWWSTSLFEIPIVDNPPISEGERFNVLNLPENPSIEFNPIQMATARNPINPYFVNNNPDVFGSMGTPYGWAFQSESWGSQNGLSYMWPWVSWTAPMVFGPSRACLAANIYPVVYGWPGFGRSLPTTEEWPGIGEPVGVGDVNWTQTPWNTPTGYIGFTFGSTGFVPTGYVDKWVSQYTWIPNKYRVFQPSRAWRAVNNTSQAIETLEKVTYLTSNSKLAEYNTPWIKRRVNFMLSEMRAIYRRIKAQGFTCAHYDLDDEYYSYFNDFRPFGVTGGVCSAPATSLYFSGWTGVGNTYVYNNFMYPNNSPNGASWYSSFSGQSAAPNSLIASGITSLRGLFLARGFTTTVGNLRNVDGFTFLGQAGICGNISRSGSAFQFLTSEHYAVLKDWLAYMWTDWVDDFKIENSILADNSLSGDYGYYDIRGAVTNYYNPGWTSSAIEKFISIPEKTSTSVVPFPANPRFDGDPVVTKYYGYNQAGSLGGGVVATSVPLSYQTQVGDIGIIHPYGSLQVDITSNVFQQIDRNNEYIGNSYGFNVTGTTFNVNNIPYYILLSPFASNYGPLPNFMYDSRKSIKFFPKGIFNMNHLPERGVTLWCGTCAEIIGQTGFFRYDPLGISGSCAPAALKVSSDRAPTMISWLLNPVWGINLQRLSENGNIGPANYVPQKGLEIRDGLTMASVTVRRTGTNTALSTDNFDACGNPFPGNTLPPGTIYKHYWTHWYPLAFAALLGDIKWGRGLACTNVARANFERKNPNVAPRKEGSIWFGVQKPIASWIASQLWVTDNNKKLDLSNNLSMGSFYFVPQGITFNYLLVSNDTDYSPPRGTAKGVTYLYGENGPMAYECIRHQYLNKTGRFAYWNPGDHCYITSESNTPIHCTSGQWPAYYPPAAVVSNPRTPNNGITGLGVCGAIRMRLARKVNNVIGECQNLGKGIVYETISLDPVRMDERSYIASGAQLVDGSYLWRITFAHPATQSPIIVRGSVTGVTTAYNVNGITDYINIPNSKFGIWWSSNYYETPIVENPPVSEAERLNVLNLPETPAFVYDPFTMEEADLIPLTTKDLFYTPNAYSTEGIQSDTVAWFGQRRETIATFQGIPYQGNSGSPADPKGRAYAFEYDPVSPTASSPWHNVVYELAIDPYKWGMRGFMMYWPFGSIPTYNYPMRYLDLWDQEYFTSTSNASRSPSRIRGFTSAIKNLLEGKLTPAGFSAINEPCNVMLYLMGINGFPECRWGFTSGSTYYPGSMNFWDRCYERTGSTVGANNLYYSYIDRMVEDIVSMTRGVTTGKLCVTVDSAAVSANPGTIKLFQDLTSPYTRGASYELGDWYFTQKLKENNIPTYIEARPAKQYSLSFCGITTGVNKTLVPGYCGATAMSLWRNHLSVEYTLWRTNPRFANQESFLERFVPDNEVSTVWRWVQNSGPLGASFDPYKVPMTVFTQGSSWNITFENGVTTYFYTPHQALFNLYTASDVYRKQKNHLGSTFAGVVYDYYTKGMVIEYAAFSRGSCGNREVNPTNNASSLTGYYRITTDNSFEGNRIGYARERGFCAASFIANPVSYGTQAGINNSAPGWWQGSGMSFWRQNVKQPSFTGFVQMLDNFSLQAIPSGGNSAGWDGDVYPFDSYSNNIIPLSMRLPERTPIYAFAWSWPNDWVWSGNYIIRSNNLTNILAYSGDLNVQKIANDTTSVWVYQNIKSNIETGVLAPDGTNSAFGFGTTGDGAGGNCYASIRQQQYNLKPGTTYTFSYYRRTSPGATGGSIRLRDVTGNPNIDWLETTITFPTAGWYRVQQTFTTKPTQTGVEVYILSRNNSASETSGVTVYLWGPQLEEGLTATPYVRTTGFRDARGGCIGTTGPIYDYNETAWLNYGASNGISYVWPFVNFYRISGWSINNTDGWTLNSEISRMTSKFTKLPRGRKAFQPTLFNREDWFEMVGNSLSATGSINRTFYGNTYPFATINATDRFYSPWNDVGISAGLSFYTEVLGILGACGATLDYIIGDNETFYVQNFTLIDTARVGQALTGYVQDPRYNQSWRGLSSWRSFMDSYGSTWTQIQGPFTNKTAYLVWNNIGRQHMAKAHDEMWGKPSMSRYTDAIVANYADWISEGGPSAGPPDAFGHPQFKSSYVGNAVSPNLYGEITQIDFLISPNNVRVLPADPTYLNVASGAGASGVTLSRGTWTSFTQAMQEIRSIKRATPYTPFVPWIASVRYTGDLGANGITRGMTLAPVVGFADAMLGYNPITGMTHGVAGNSAYYYELIRHISMHGVKAFAYWNSTSFQLYSTPPANTSVGPQIIDREYYAGGYTFYQKDIAQLDVVLREINQKTGGYSPFTATTERISWLANYIVSGAPGPTGGYNWRVTVKPGITGLLANGVTLKSPGSTVGTWIWTPGPTLTGIGLTLL